MIIKIKIYTQNITQTQNITHIALMYINYIMYIIYISRHDVCRVVMVCRVSLLCIVGLLCSSRSRARVLEPPPNMRYTLTYDTYILMTSATCYIMSHVSRG